MKPDQLALILISNVIGEELQSGSHHVYRGVLNMIGNDMRAVWGSVQRELLARGYCDEAEVAKDNEWLSRQINQGGRMKRPSYNNLLQPPQSASRFEVPAVVFGYSGALEPRR